MYVLKTMCWIFCFVLLIIKVDGQRKNSNICRQHNDCPINAHCQYGDDYTKGQCVCNIGYVIGDTENQKECYPVAQTLNDQCQFDAQCMITLSTDSECRYNECLCKEGTHFVPKENKCYASVQLGNFCRLTNNCIGENTFCRSGICVCPIDKHANYYNTACLNNARLLDKCSINEECIDENSRCHDVCRCSGSHTLSTNQSVCLKIASQLSDECSEDVQCNHNIPYSMCKLGEGGDYGLCECRDGHHQVNYGCFVTVELGGICETDENCANVIESVCFEGRCNCPDGLTIIDGVCSSCTKVYFNLLGLLLILLYCFKEVLNI